MKVKTGQIFDLGMYQLFNCTEFVFLYLAPQKLGAINCRFAMEKQPMPRMTAGRKPFFFDAALKDMAEKP